MLKRAGLPLEQPLPPPTFLHMTLSHERPHDGRPSGANFKPGARGLKPVCKKRLIPQVRTEFGCLDWRSGMPARKVAVYKPPPAKLQLCHAMSKAASISLYDTGFSVLVSSQRWNASPDIVCSGAECLKKPAASTPLMLS